MQLECLHDTAVSISNKCSVLALQSHLPGYVENYDKLKAAGAEVIACVSVNDVFVMEAWGKDNKAEGKVSPQSISW